MAPSHSSIEQVERHIANIHGMTVALDDKVIFAFRRALFERLVSARQRYTVEPNATRRVSIDVEIDTITHRLRALAALEVFRNTILKRYEDERRS